MNYAKLSPEYIRSGVIHPEYAKDVELLAYDMARLGCQWHEFKKVLKDLIITNLTNKNVNRHQIAKRMGIVPHHMYEKKDG